MEQTQSSRARFGPFEIDLRAGELHGKGEAILLPEQVFQVLRFLIEREGELVTRDELKKKLWPNDTVVEFEHSINAAIRKLRKILDDSAQNPRYIETLASRGYRLMVPVEWVGAESAAADSAEESSASDGRPGSSSDSDGERIPKAQLKVGRLTGKVVSHYRVLEVIGGGGMGLVYRAEDLKLGRAVALKFLPEEVGDDPKARERFEREAHAVSSLNHPNICTVYDFDEYQGHPFIAMELLQGKTLRDHLGDGRFRLTQPEGLDVAIQIASGLEAAHEKGIIHRDIKPANIFINEKNVAKILDFGVAKVLSVVETSESPHPGKGSRSGAPAVDGAPEDDVLKGRGDQSHAGLIPAQSSHDGDDGAPEGAPLQKPNESSLTRTGTKLGTAGYMSPEQVRGEPLDPRTDIFSFGLVLYEMATGQRAFSGETAAVVRDGILNNSPAPLRELNSALPARLAATIDKCLEKDREQRYQSAEELRKELTQLVLDTDSSLSVNKTAVAPVERRVSGGHLVVAAAVLLLVVGGVSAFLYRRAQTAHVPHFDVENMRMTRLTDNGEIDTAAISPDGRYLTYSLREAPHKLWVRQISAERAVEIVASSAESFWGLTFSPDGAYLYFLRANKAFVIPTLGGEAREVIGETFSGVGVSPDGNRLAFVLGGDSPKAQLLVSNRDGTGQHVIAEHPLSSGTEFRSTGAPGWSPDAKFIAVGAQHHGKSVLHIYPAQGGPPKVIPLPGGLWRAIWLPDQSGLLLSMRTSVSSTSPPQLWLQPFPSGNLQRLTNDLDSYRSVTMSADGKLLSAVQEQPSLRISVSPVSHPDDGMTIRAGKSDGAAVAWLPNGTLFTETTESDFASLSPDGKERVPLFDRQRFPEKVWGVVPGDFSICKDGHLILAREGVWRSELTGEKRKQLTAGNDESAHPDCSADSQSVVYVSGSAANQIMRVSIDGSKPTVLSSVNRVITGLQFSPDGQWIADSEWGEKDDAGYLVIRDAETGQATQSFRIPEGLGPPWNSRRVLRWTPDGRMLTVLLWKGVGSPVNIWGQPISGGPLRQLTHFPDRVVAYDWSQDGKRLIITRSAPTADVVLITNFH